VRHFWKNRRRRHGSESLAHCLLHASFTHDSRRASQCCGPAHRTFLVARGDAPLTPLNLSTSSLSAPPGQRPHPERTLVIQTHESQGLAGRMPWLESYVTRGGQLPLSRHPAWMTVLQRGLGHTPYCLEAVEEGKTCGILPLAYVRSLLFGRFLVSLPYLNYGGVLADDNVTAGLLLDGAVQLADRLKVRYLELRSETAADHPKLARTRADKVHMRLPLPATPGTLWDQLSTKVRNQVRKGQKSGLSVTWGTHDLLSEFHEVFSANMRDLGTPTYGKKLFATGRRWPRACCCTAGASRRFLAPVRCGVITTPAPTCYYTGTCYSVPSSAGRRASTSGARARTVRLSASRSSGARRPSRPRGNATPVRGHPRTCARIIPRMADSSASGSGCRCG
jgi:hypothetical protein